ncbi:CCA tRNA nucleotidyltransferase [Sphingomonas panacisoli]|uniref:CCA tRNA nucleotidyltransferase n=1 Tax=Sphingomonas panacisoli TaxID=1813879 RepID=A0A5B8LIX8_9SPHN|nr:CCA tRNA nucleotidyltransferase [Sphingomonas panacisoli]QDZ07809.1 CCA tRNA nucleotidyltransferase [Sphingomonas panacisoli]
MGGVILPAAAWRDHPGLKRVVDALGPGNARIVGGAVRDTLLGIDTADIDLATTHAPDAVVDLLEAARIKAVPTGIKHGTITAVASDAVYEVTTLRRDLETDGRHATVAFTDDWREDAARRDFTINALYADPVSGDVFDYFDGIADLEARRVRFIGDPLTRIAEDHLRILRFFRFLARFGDEPDPDGLKACTDRANDLMALSRERIANELLRLLVAPRAPEVVALMLERGIFAPVLPEIGNLDRFVRTVRREERTQRLYNALLRLVSLVPTNTVESVGARLKLSNADRKRMLTAAEPLKTANAKELRYRLGAVGAHDQILLADLTEGAVDRMLAEIDAWTVPTFPMSGGQLVAKGLTAGPDVARTLHKIEDRWIAEGFPDADRVAAIADDEVAQLLADIRKS